MNTENKDWLLSSRQEFWGEVASNDHIVHIYDNDNSFLDTLESFASDGLSLGESVIIIATPDHLYELNLRLRDLGYNLDLLIEQDRYITMDAREAASHIMVDSWPDEDKFRNFVTALKTRAMQNSSKVRVFGEIVAILWKQGYQAATIQLENLWHRLQNNDFCLYCAYPQNLFAYKGEEEIKRITCTHSMLISCCHHDHAEIRYLPLRA